MHWPTDLNEFAFYFVLMRNFKQVCTAKTTKTKHTHIQTIQEINLNSLLFEGTVNACQKNDRAFEIESHFWRKTNFSKDWPTSSSFLIEIFLIFYLINTYDTAKFNKIEKTKSTQYRKVFEVSHFSGIEESFLYLIFFGQ